MKVTTSKVIGVVLMLAAIITIISLTLGREIVAGRQPGLWSFSTIHFAGYLFFLLMPVEALVPFYQAEGHAGTILVGLAVSTAIGAQLIDYGIGYLVSDKIINDVLGRKKYERLNVRIDKYGGWAIFLFNLIPLSSPNMLLLSGMVRFRAVRALLISAAGLTAKYLVIVYLFGNVSAVG